MKSFILTILDVSIQTSVFYFGGVQQKSKGKNCSQFNSLLKPQKDILSFSEGISTEGSSFPHNSVIWAKFRKMLGEKNCGEFNFLQKRERNILPSKASEGRYIPKTKTRCVSLWIALSIFCIFFFLTKFNKGLKWKIVTSLFLSWYANYVENYIKIVNPRLVWMWRLLLYLLIFFINKFNK